MKKIILVVLGVFLIQGCATIEEKKYVQLKEEIVRKTTLSSGVSIITKEVPNNIVSFQIWFKVGARSEDDSNNGISHFIEHLIFKGSKKRGVNQLSEEIEGVGGRLNGGTSKDYTCYYVTIAKDFLDIAVDGMMDSVLNPLFDKNEIEKERKVVVEEILRQQDNPHAYLYNLLNSISYDNHPYKRPVIGKREIIENLSSEAISRYYNDNYTLDNMVIVAVGDFVTDELVRKLKKNFVNVTLRRKTENVKIKPIFKAERWEENTDFKQCYIALAWIGPDVDSKDTYVMDVLTVVLGEGRSSRLYTELKENQQLCYSIRSSYSTMKDDGLFVISAEVDEKNNTNLEKKIIEEVNKIKETGITVNELNKVKTLIENNYIFDHEVNEEVASSLGYYDVISSYKLELSYIENIKKVTLNDVKKAANKYLTDNYSVVLLKPK